MFIKSENKRFSVFSPGGENEHLPKMSSFDLSLHM